MNVKIDIDSIKSVLHKVLKGDISREHASAWAIELRTTNDQNSLEYYPREFEAILWHCIIFIEGIDLKDAPDSYLHNEGDIKGFLEQLPQ